MSVNFYRVASKDSVNNKEYKIKSNIINQEPYWDEGYHYYPRHRNGFDNWYKKQILMYQVRMYRTWKHNRKTQWKS